MSYMKGVWYSHDNGSYIEIRSDSPDMDALPWSAIGDVCSSKYCERGDVSDDNAKRIVDCVNACDGMDDPLLEIARLRASVSELTRHLTACANELTFMIDEHNEQNMGDGSWKYDHQTPWEALHLIDGMGVK